MTDTGTDTARIVAEYPRAKKEILDQLLDYGEYKEIVTATLDVVLESEGFDNKTPYDARISQLEQHKDNLVKQRDDLDAQIDSLRDRIDTLHRQRESVLSATDEYLGELRNIERDLRFRPDDHDTETTLRHVWPGHPRIQRLADAYDKFPNEVLEDLRARNPDVPDDAFTEHRHASQTFTGLPDEQAKLPLEERSHTEGGR